MDLSIKKDSVYIDSRENGGMRIGHHIASNKDYKLDASHINPSDGEEFYTVSIQTGDSKTTVFLDEQQLSKLRIKLSQLDERD